MNRLIKILWTLELLGKLLVTVNRLMEKLELERQKRFILITTETEYVIYCENHRMIVFRKRVLFKKEPIADKLIFLLPEDYQGELQALRERWMKRNYPPREIRRLTYKHLFHSYWGLIQSKFENLRLPKHNTGKEIE